MRRIASVVSLLCAFAFDIGLAEPAPQALAAAADAPTLLPADQTPDDEKHRVHFLVPVLGTADLGRGSHIVGLASRAPWPARHRGVSDLARAPPH